MPTPIRFKGIVGTTAQIATDRFEGRIAFDSTLNRFVVFYDATNYAINARRDVLETFALGIQDSTLTDGLPMYASTSGRLATESIADFRTRIDVAKASDKLDRIPTTITGQNADSYITNGIFVGATVTNAPDAGWGILRVMRNGSDAGDQVWQDWFPAAYTGKQVYRRGSTDFGVTWSDWETDYPFIAFPAPDPVRNHVDIVVPDAGVFVDNVLAIQNRSSGLFFGSTSWGNAAINFKDIAGTERAAVGYSRNSVLQPAGYIADTLYLEIGNPFTSDSEATYLRVMATIAAGSPYWGGAAKQWTPFEVSSRTGKITLDAGSGGEATNVINGPLVVGEAADVQPIQLEMSATSARIREFSWSDMLGVTTNISNLAAPYTLDDNAKSGWMSLMGWGSGAGADDSWTLKRVPPGGGAAATVAAVSAAGHLTVPTLQTTGLATLASLSVTGATSRTVSSTTEQINGNIYNQYTTVTQSGIVTQQSLAGTGAGSRTIGAGRLNSQGSGIDVYLCGTYTTDGSAGNATIRIRLGSTTFRTIGSFALDNNVTNGIWYIRGRITCRTTGATGTVGGQMMWEHQSSSVAGAQLLHIEPSTATGDVTIDLTAAQTFDVDWTADDAGTSITCTCFSLNLVR